MPFHVRLTRRLLLPGALGLFLCGPATRSAFAGEPVLDITTLTDLEQHASTAEARERCFLYSELLHGWTEIASKAMASGDDDAAAKAMAHADADAAQLKAALARNSKKLMDAEQLLQRTAHHLTDMVRAASLDQQGTMEAVLKHLNNVHDALLAQIFAH